MNRITRPELEHPWVGKHGKQSPGVSLRPGHSVIEALFRLWKYENTGKTPEEIEEMDMIKLESVKDEKSIRSEIEGSGETLFNEIMFVLAQVYTTLKEQSGEGAAEYWKKKVQDIIADDEGAVWTFEPKEVTDGD